jgi:hypothetical protein
MMLPLSSTACIACHSLGSRSHSPCLQLETRCVNVLVLVMGGTLLRPRGGGRDAVPSSLCACSAGPGCHAIRPMSMHRATLPPQDGAEPVDEVPRLEQKCPLTPVMSLLGVGRSLSLCQVGVCKARNGQRRQTFC